MIVLWLLACGGRATDTAETGLPAYVTPTTTTTTTFTLDTSDARATWIGLSSAGFLNYAAPLGDVDGDGTIDHLLQNIESATQFSAWIVSGSETSAGPVDQLARAHLDVQAMLHPDFGAVGDVDGDGLADVSVSDQQSPATVHLISGTVTGTVDPYGLAFATAANVWTTRPWTSGWFAIERDTALPDVQRVYLLGAGAAGAIDAPSAAIATLEMPTPGGLDSALLERLDSADLDGDGIDELVASDFRWGPGDGFTQTPIGRVLAYPTPLSGTIPTSAAVVDIAPDDGLGWEFGFDLATGDLDGDGRTDLAVCARGRDTNGGVWVFFDPTTATTLTDADAELLGSSTGRTFGVGTFAGDLAVRWLDGPGALLLFDAPSGALSPDGATSRITGIGPGDQLGATGSIGTDILLGAPGASAGAGEVHLFDL